MAAFPSPAATDPHPSGTDDRTDIARATEAWRALRIKGRRDLLLAMRSLPGLDPRDGVWALNGPGRENCHVGSDGQIFGAK